jgi:hypothetical protein
MIEFDNLLEFLICALPVPEIWQLCFHILVLQSKLIQGKKKWAKKQKYNNKSNKPEA